VNAAVLASALALMVAVATAVVQGFINRAQNEKLEKLRFDFGDRSRLRELQVQAIAAVYGALRSSRTQSLGELRLLPELFPSPRSRGQKGSGIGRRHIESLFYI